MLDLAGVCTHSDESGAHAVACDLPDDGVTAIFKAELPLLLPCQQTNGPITHATMLRRPPCDFGWDRNMALGVFGLVGAIRLEPVAPRIGDMRVAQSHGNSQVTSGLTVHAMPQDVIVVVWNKTKVFTLMHAMARMESALPSPQLWWPAGQGAQGLHDQPVTGKGVSATRRIGLRDMAPRSAPDTVGRSFGIAVNVRLTFAKGANRWRSSSSAGAQNFGDFWHVDTSGDMHFRSIWHEGRDFDHYCEVAPEFCRESGLLSYPSKAVIRKFADPKDRNIASPMMESHQKNAGGNARCYAPDTVIALPNDPGIERCAVNDRPEPAGITVTAQVEAMDGASRFLSSAKITAPIHASVPVLVSAPDALEPGEVLTFTWAGDAEGEALHAPKPWRSNDLLPSDLTADSRQIDRDWKLTFKVNILTPFVPVKSEVRVCFSANALTLFPGQPVAITFMPRYQAFPPTFTFRNLQSAPDGGSRKADPCSAINSIPRGTSPRYRTRSTCWPRPATAPSKATARFTAMIPRSRRSRSVLRPPG